MADHSADLNLLSVVPLTPDMDASALQGRARDSWLRAVDVMGLPPLDAAVSLTTPFPALGAWEDIVAPPLRYVAATPCELPVPQPSDARQAIAAWRRDASGIDATRTAWPEALALAQSRARCLALSEDRADIPLILARRMASALAVCHYHGDDGLALLVADFSGIQPYLFEISEVGAGGVARSLRARSFFIAQLGALLARTIQDRLALGPHNTLLNAGGKFHMLIPWTDATRNALPAIRSEAAEWCLRMLHGELAVNIATEMIKPEDLRAGGFGDALTRADLNLRYHKARRLADALTGGAGWRADAFLGLADYGDSGPCRACGRFPAEPDAGKCSWCLDDERRGRDLTRAQWVSYAPDSGAAMADVRAFGWAAHIGHGAPPERRECWRFEPATREPYRFVARHVPLDQSGERMTFEDIAASAQGRPYLAYLKADVDRLGERMALGFCRDADPAYDDPARIAHLSELLEEFFAGRLEKTVRAHYPLCYVVFSGGDDMTIVGPHDAIVRLALQVAEDFRAFLGYDTGPPVPTDTLTISAGIVVATSRRPLSVAVGLAERELHRAKREGRCRLGIFGQTLSWQQALAAHRTLWQASGEPTPLGAELLDTSKTSSAFLYHMLAYARMWARYRAGDTSQIRYQPMLAYEIGRNIERNALPNVHAWASDLAQITAGPPGTGWQAAMDRLGVVVRLAILNRSSSRE